MGEMLTTEELLAAFASGGDADPELSPSMQAERDAYLDAAAVLHLFRPQELKVEAMTGAAANHVIEYASPAVGWSTERLWTLSTSARRAAFERMATRDAMQRTRQLNVPPTQTVIQTVLDRWLSGEVLPVSTLSAAELDAVRTIGDWGLAGRPHFPDLAEVGAAWRRRGLVADFEKLADGFVGRREELVRLRDFLEPGGRSTVERLRSKFAGQDARALFLEGLGGVGKSALVARVILDFFDGPTARSVPFLYLTFDDPAINPVEPQTLIGAALLQLEAQVASVTGQRAGEARDAVAELRDRMYGHTRARRRLKERATTTGSQRGRIGQLRQLDDDLIKAFAQALRRLAEVTGGGRQAPFLFVLDTFEEASYRPETDLGLLYDLLAGLMEQVPTLRLLMVGRAVPEGKRFDRLHAEALTLGDLAFGDALDFLEREQLPRDAATSVVAQLGTNPLTLRLCVRALRDLGGIDKLPGDAIASAGQEVIRGYLYRRILNHIHDPVVRRLAHPGMVLQRVTAEIILEVLAPVCDVRVDTLEEARAVLDNLAREHSLVSRAPDGALIYREEVRRPMLALINADSPDEVSALHEAAFFHYSFRRNDDEQGRVEALYHRLMLPDPQGVIGDDRWSNRVAGKLAAAVDELPPAGRVALASLTRINLDEQDRRAASAEDKDRLVGREVLAAIRFNDFDTAQRMLDRPITPGSGLAPLRVRVLIGLGRYEEAARYAAEQLAAFPALGERVRLAELMWFGAQALRGGSEAATLLGRLVPVAARLSPITELQVLTELVAIGGPEPAEAARDRLATVLATFNMGTAFGNGPLVRLALARMGPCQRPLWAMFVNGMAADLPFNLAERSPDALALLREDLLNALAEANDPDLSRARDLLADAPLEGRALHHLLDLIGRALQNPDGDFGAVVAAHLLCVAEGTTLAASALAGLDDRRERWETDSASEATA